MLNGNVCHVPFLRMDRKYFCTCAWWNRPHMDVFYVGPGCADANGDYIG